MGVLAITKYNYLVLVSSNQQEMKYSRLLSMLISTDLLEFSDRIYFT